MNNFEAAQKFLHESAWKSGSTVLSGSKPALELPLAKNEQIIPLPDPGMLHDHHVNFLEMVELRSTVRQYSNVPLTLEELSYLLWCTQGVKAANPNMTLRTVPSAGASHSLETYILLNNVSGLAKGIYRFLAIEHALIPVSADIEAVMKCFSTYKVVHNSAVVFIWSTVIERLSFKFGLRGYRYAFIDAGHVCQNLYLAAQTINTGVCPLGAFEDEKLNELLNFDNDKQFVIYGAAMGKV
ncbi:SagB/ThcOx family dehydrogenase [Pectinatus sottacetonis]|uniref:SagB/ThcOx family dehydrogenase n=1 Tax=Pectinatus sottacetonis TaxID=1002795 RepID=UPI0018C57368|nr:SagB/ThcOx family dehydrogenase [Pectinatus sottacetonis]